MNEMHTGSLVSIRNLSKKYGKHTALKDVSLDIPRGRIIGLLGPNGSGKTTLIKLMNGLLTPGKGQILIDGNLPGVGTKACVSYLPPAIRVKQPLSYFTDFYADFDRQKALSMLSSLQISPDASLKTLSKGTKEKVQLIMVMSRRAQLYILDEPIAGVDPAARDYILKTIIQDYSEEASILLSTHLISDIEPILDDVLFLRAGHVVLSASAEGLRQREGLSVEEKYMEVFGGGGR